MNRRTEVKSDARRSLPAVDRLVRGLEKVARDIPLWALREAAREVLEAERARLGGASPETSAALSEAELCERAHTRAAEPVHRHQQPRDQRDRRRAAHQPRPRAARAARRARSRSRRQLRRFELDLATGERGSRTRRSSADCACSPARGAPRRNNNAAAVLLLLAGLARARR